MRVAGNFLEQRRRQTRLADAGFAGKQDDAPLALLRLLPPMQQQLQLLVAAQQGSDASLAQSLEPAFRRAAPEDLPGVHRLGEALEGYCTEVKIVEQLAGE